MTAEQARQIFDELHQDGDRWKKFGGNLSTLEQRRTADKVKAREMLDRLARRVR